MNEIDIKRRRDAMIAKKALNESARQRSEMIMESLRKTLSGITEENLQKLRDRGVGIDDLLRFDLERVMRDKAYHQEFIRVYASVVRDLDTIIEREAGGM